MAHLDKSRPRASGIVNSVDRMPLWHIYPSRADSMRLARTGCDSRAYMTNTNCDLHIEGHRSTAWLKAHLNYIDEVLTRFGEVTDIRNY